MAKAEVDAGVCGEYVEIEVYQTSRDTVGVRINSDCEMLASMNEELAEVKWRGKDHEVFRPIPESAVYQAAGCHLRHTGCPIPAAIVKAIEVEVGIAVPRDVTIRIHDDASRDESSDSISADEGE